jgi:hypothetical protein
MKNLFLVIVILFAGSQAVWAGQNDGGKVMVLIENEETPTPVPAATDTPVSIPLIVQPAKVIRTAPVPPAITVSIPDEHAAALNRRMDEIEKRVLITGLIFGSLILLLFILMSIALNGKNKHNDGRK